MTTFNVRGTASDPVKDTFIVFGKSGPTPQPGSLTVVGVRRNNNRIRSMQATLTDENGVTAVNSVRWRIMNASGTVRFTHTSFSVRETLPNKTVTIAAIGIPGNFRAGATNSLEVRVTYTDETGTYTITETERFTT